ncbi:MAG: TrkH family potassium uptake protein [Ruminococcaceae bacterium]|nr:TrkH family potassium uptake protein [Oscillospiraceae bacterium]
MNLRMIKYTLGWLLMFEAGFFLVPIITAAAYREREIIHFALAMAICAAVAALMLIGKPKTRTMYAREGFIIVALSWILLSIFGSLPFMFTGVTTSFVDALFETVSGFTTTGASILPAVEDLPRCILMWRSFTHWVGGMGVLVFMMAFLPLGGAKNMHIMKAESPGPSVSKLVPHVRTTALILYSIYFILTVIQFILLLCGGMSVFEALNTAFATAGTGGFGVKNDSMASYSSYLQIVVTVFMLLFSLNFSAYYLAFKCRFKDAFNSEIRAFLCIVAVAIALVTFNIRDMFSTVGEALKHSAFTVASLISTTGFSTTDFAAWPAFAITVMLLVMFVGACAGSTGGGIKVSRIIILFKGVIKEIKSLLHPRRVNKITMDSRPVEPDVVRGVNSYIVFYVLLFASSVLILSVENYDFLTTFSAVTATINNVGPGMSMVGPMCNFVFLSPLSKMVLIFDMLAGRLELFPMLLLFAPSTWKNK